MRRWQVTMWSQEPGRPKRVHPPSHGALSLSRMKMLSIAAVVVSGTVALAGCSSGGGAQSDPNSSQGAANADCSNLQQVARWDLDRRLAQLLMGAVYSDSGETAINAAVKAIAKGQVGGVNFLGESSYAYSNNELAQAVDAGGEVPPFLAVDEEGGRVQRLGDEVGYVPSAREMAATMSPDEVRQEARRIGKAMKKLSLNMDLAPVVDVSDQAEYEVIGDRSFSDNPQTGTKYAGAFAEGLQDQNIVPVLKHFPGLGSGSGNTDFESATTPPLRKLERKDLIPYETLLQQTPVAVMLTNAKVPGLTAGKPASLSPATYELLRSQYGFQGVVMTDSLSAAAVQDNTDTAGAVAKAIVAGADIALWDRLSDVKQIHKRLNRAVKSGDLTEERINESVNRVLELKGVDLCTGR